jgi:hypothetical protein
MKSPRSGRQNLECGGNPDLSGATPLWIERLSKAPSTFHSAGALQIFLSPAPRTGKPPNVEAGTEAKEFTTLNTRRNPVNGK